MSGEGEAERVEEPNERRDEENHGTDGAEYIAALNALKQAYVDAHKDDGTKEFWHSFREYLTIGLVLITVALTGATYWVFYEQLQVSKQAIQTAHIDADAALRRAHADAVIALRNAHSDAQTALRIAHNDATSAVAQAIRTAAGTLDKAEMANQIASSTAKRQLRGYVSEADISPIPTTDKQGGNLVWHTLLRWKNAGLTPTRDAIEGLACGFTDAEIQAGVPFPHLNLGRRTIGAGDTDSSGDCMATVGQVDDQIATGKRNMFGVIVYRDIFGKVHISEQCRYINWIGDYTKANASVQYEVSLCPTHPNHNCEDEECKADEKTFRYMTAKLTSIN